MLLIYGVANTFIFIYNQFFLLYKEFMIGVKSLLNSRVLNTL